MRASADEIVADARLLAEKETDNPVTTTVLSGDPAVQIVDHASATGVDLICLGRRGLGSVRGLLLGSVSHGVAHLATQTVATVR